MLLFYSLNLLFFSFSKGQGPCKTKQGHIAILLEFITLIIHNKKNLLDEEHLNLLTIKMNVPSCYIAWQPQIAYS